jgi:hypothetical protein
MSTFVIGTSFPGLGMLLNPLIQGRIFTEAMGRAWLRHNVEEMGLLERIIPRIYPAEPG